MTSRRERFYWGTVLLTFGLGTALGDAAAINAGLGFAWSIVVFGVAILVPLGLWRLGLLLCGGLVAYVAATQSDEEGAHGRRADGVRQDGPTPSGEHPTGEIDPAGVGPKK